MSKALNIASRNTGFGSLRAPRLSRAGGDSLGFCIFQMNLDP